MKGSPINTKLIQPKCRPSSDKLTIMNSSHQKSRTTTTGGGGGEKCPRGGGAGAAGENPTTPSSKESSTTSENMNFEDFLSKIYVAAKRRDTVQLKVLLLECNSSTTTTTTTTTTPLDNNKQFRSTPPLTTKLLDHFTSLLQKMVLLSSSSTSSTHQQQQQKQQKQQQQELRLLLHVIMTTLYDYETPWICACEFVSKYCHNLSSSLSSTPMTVETTAWILTCLADIQMFLRQVLVMMMRTTTNTIQSKKGGGRGEGRREVERRHPSKDEILTECEESTSHLSNIYTSYSLTSTDQTNVEDDEDDDDSSTTTHPRRTTRFWILRLIKIIMAPLWVPTSNPTIPSTTTTTRNMNEYPSWALPLELINTLLLLGYEIDKNENEKLLLFHQSMMIPNIIFTRNEQQKQQRRQQILHPTKLLQWLRVVSKSYNLLFHDKSNNNNNNNNKEEQLFRETIRASLLHHQQQQQQQQTSLLHNQKIPMDHFPGLVEEVMTIVVTATDHYEFKKAFNNNNNKGDEAATTTTSAVIDYLCPWQQIILLLLHAGSCSSNQEDATIYEKMEQTIQSKISAFPTSLQNHWISALDDTSLNNFNNDDDDNDCCCYCIPQWVLVNLIAITTQSINNIPLSSEGGGSSKKKVVTRTLLDEIIPGKKKQKNHMRTTQVIQQQQQQAMETSFNRLISNRVIVFSSNRYSQNDDDTIPVAAVENFEDESIILKRLQQLMEGVTYSTFGKFQKLQQQQQQQEDSFEISILSKAGILVWQSINLDQQRQLRDDDDDTNTTGQFVLKRTNWWIETMLSIFERCSNNHHHWSSPRCYQEGIFAVAALTTIYIEVPFCRSEMMRRLVQSLSSTNQQQQQQLLPTSNSGKLYCSATISLIAQSLKEETFTTTKEQQQHFGPDDPSYLFSLPTLPKSIFFQLADSLSVIPSARRALLSTSMKLLDSKFPRYWGSTTNTATTTATHQTGNPMMSNHQDRVQCGLFGLVILFNAEKWEKCETTVQAWSHLSDILVLNQPPIPLESRSWLYDMLETFIRRKCLTRTSSEHLLPAVLVRSLSLFQHNTTPTCTPPQRRSQFLVERAFLVWRDPAIISHSQTRRTCQVEDVAGLARLIVSLLMIDSSTDQSKFDVLLFEGRYALLTEALGGTSENSKSKDEQRDTVSSFTSKSKTRDTLPFNHRIALTILRHIFKHVINLDASADIEGLEMRQGVLPMPDLSNAISELCAKESQDLRAIVVANHNENDTPSWTELSPSASRHYMTQQIDGSVLIQMNLSLCDFMVELLFGSQSDVVANQTHRANGGFRNRFLVLGPILRSKRILESQQQQQQDQEICFVSKSMDLATVAKTAVEFFWASSIALKDALANSRSLVETENIIEPLMSYCSVVKQLTSRPERTLDSLRPVSRLLESLWQLFITICDEGASIRFIDYIEASKKRKKSSREAGREEENNQGTLRSLRSGSDIDLAIRVIREAVLQALNSCFDLAWSEQSNFWTASNSLSLDSESHTPLDHLCYYAKYLAKDLQLGLEGNSGGVSEDMYLAYVDSIANCSALLKEQADLTCEWEGLHSALVAVVEVSRIVGEIVCTFPLTESLVFKKTLILSVSVLPSLHRHICRRCCLVDTNLSFSETDMHFTMNDFAEMGAFSDCFTILSRWSSLRDPTSEPWEDIAGSDHARENDVPSNQDNSDFQGLDLIEELKMKAKTGMSENDFQGTVLKTGAEGSTPIVSKWKLHLPSKETWYWALSCIFLAMDEKWTESLDIMLTHEKMLEHTKRDSLLVSFQYSRQVQLYSEDRRRELSRSIQNACSLLDSFDALKGKQNSGRTPLLDLLAMHLPNATKGRLCSLLCRISVVLYRAVNLLCDRLLDVCNGKIDERCDLASVESLCCVSAWLMPNSGESDFVYGARTWYYVEKRKKNVKKDTSSSSVEGGGAGNFLLAMLPKVFTNVERLQGCLRKLQGILSKMEVDGLSWPLLATVGGGIAQSNTKPATISLLQLVSDKLKQDGWKTQTDTSPSSPFESPGYSSTKTRPRNGKRRKRNREGATTTTKVTKPRRRRIDLRSRNRVIDLWLSMDDDIGQGADGADADAYVDLEDFLVFG